MPVTATQLSLRSAPVLAVLVCHNGAEWLPRALSALGESTLRPRHVVAVDTGSDDETAELLAAAADGDDAIVDGVVTAAATTGFAAALGQAVEHASQRWGDPGSWLWILHDDCAPEPACLDILLRAAEASPAAGVIGPLAVDWADPRLVVDAGISTDSSGHRRRVVTNTSDGHSAVAESATGEPAEILPEQTTEVLAVPSAGSLISRSLWEDLDGYDRELAVFAEDLDFGWRANVAGSLVLNVPAARIRHVRALSSGRRTAEASRMPVRAAQRAHGMRTFLVNCSALAFVFGVPRLLVLSVLRALGFLLVRDGAAAHAELTAAGHLLSGAGGLRAARATRAHASVRGLFVGRFTRLRAALRNGVRRLVRNRVAGEAVLGKLPQQAVGESAWHPGAAAEADNAAPRPSGPDALPAGAVRPARGRASTRLRKPAEVLAVAVPRTGQSEAPARPVASVPAEQRTAPAGAADSAGGRDSDARELVFVEVNKRRIISATVLAPPVLLTLVLTAVAVAIHWGRLGLDPAGGSLLPVGQLGQVWSSYLASWHPVAGGVAGSAPPALAVLGVLGAPLAPVGGPAAFAAVLLLGDIPLAALSAYAATARLPVNRWLRVGVAAAYGLLPVAGAGVAQGRLGVIVAHLLLPPLLAGIGAVLTRSSPRWLSVAVGTALCLAVVGAFAPILHGVALAGLLLGLLFSRWPGGRVRAVAAAAIVVILPLGLLLPWVPTLVTHPKLLLYGVTGQHHASGVSVAGLAGLDPGGPGALPTGVVLLLAAVVAAAARPNRRVVPGVAVVLLGVATVVVVRLLAPADSHAGPAIGLLVVGAGLLLVVLGAGAGSATALPGVMRRLGVAGGVLALLALATSGVLRGGDGPLHADGGVRLASASHAELADTSRAVLVLGSGDDPPRQVAGRMPRFGDEALAVSASGATRLRDRQQGLLAGDRDAVTSAVASGVEFVVLPPGHDGAALRHALPKLVGSAPATSDGRSVVRLTPQGGSVMLLSPVEAHRAVNGQAPSGDLSGGKGTVVESAEPPDVGVRVSGGPSGRLLVLAAELEPGWTATVNGDSEPIVSAWGHQVGVAVPGHQSEVTVRFSSSYREVLLLVQVAAALFALFTVIPGRRGKGTGHRGEGTGHRGEGTGHRGEGTGHTGRHAAGPGHARRLRDRR